MNDKEGDSFPSGLNLALKLAITNDLNNQWMLGAVVKRSGAVLSFGINKPKNDPSYIDYEHCSVHAEMDALRQIEDAKGCVIYVARITRGGAIALARPCELCWTEIVNCGIKRILWTVDSKTYGQERIRSLYES